MNAQNCVGRHWHTPLMSYPTCDHHSMNEHQKLLCIEVCRLAPEIKWDFELHKPWLMISAQHPT